MATVMLGGSFPPAMLSTSLKRDASESRAAKGDNNDIGCDRRLDKFFAGDKWQKVREAIHSKAIHTDDPYDLPVDEAPWRSKTWQLALNPLKNEAWRVSALLALLILFGTGQKVFFKLMLFPMKDYVFLINQVQVLFFIPLFFLFSWMHRSGRNVEESEPPTATSPGEDAPTAADIAAADHLASRQIILIAALEFCNMFLQLLAGSYLPGAVQVLLAQVRIPVTMAMSAFLLHTKYTARQYFGVALTFSGIVTAVLPALFETTDLNENEPADESVGPVVWSLVLMAAAVPSCLANVTRERILKGVSTLGKDPYWLALRISVFQFVLGLPLLVILAPMNGLSLRELPDNFYKGSRCWLTGQSTPPVAPPGVDKCAGAPFSTWSFLLCNFAYNLIQMVVFRYASASIQIVATTMIIPLSAMAFTLPAVMGSYAQPLHFTDIVATVLIACGVVIYKSVIRFNIQYFNYSFGMMTEETRVPLTSVVKHHSKEEEMILLSLGDLAYKFGIAKKYGNIWKQKASKSDLSDDNSPLLPENVQSNSSGLSWPVYRDITSTSSTRSQQSYGSL
eukprot:g47145.t1